MIYPIASPLGPVPRRLAAAFADNYVDGRGDSAPGTATAALGRVFRRRVPEDHQRPANGDVGLGGSRAADPPR